MQVPESYLSSLSALSMQFGVVTLYQQCDKMMERFKLNKKLFDSGRRIEISYPISRAPYGSVFLNKLPIDVKKLSNFQNTGEYSDVEIYIEGYGEVTHSHRIVLGLWSVPFTKVCQVSSYIKYI